MDREINDCQCPIPESEAAEEKGEASNSSSGDRIYIEFIWRHKHHETARTQHHHPVNYQGGGNEAGKIGDRDTQRKPEPIDT